MVSHAPTHSGGAHSTPQFLSFLSIYAYTLWRRTTKFHVVTHMGRGLFVFKLSAKHPTQGHVFPALSNFLGSLSLSVLMATYLVNRVSWCLLKQRMMGWWWQLDNWSYKSCKAPVKSLPPTNQHQFFTGRMPFLSPNQQCRSTEGKISHSMDLLTPSSHGVLQLCLWPPIAPGYLGGGLPCLSSALWCQYPS